MKTTEEVGYSYLEIGINSIQNSRLVNQIKLSELTEIDFIPKVLNFKGFDNSDGFEVENIIGNTLHELMQSVPTADFFKLLIQASKQLETLFDLFGIIIKDRNKDNFILGKKQNDTSLNLYQVDLESIYDTVTDLDRIDVEVSLRERKKKELVQKDLRRSQIEIADVCDSILEIALEYLKIKGKDGRNQKERSLYLKLHHMIGSVRMNNFKKLTLFLQQAVTSLK